MSRLRRKVVHGVGLLLLAALLQGGCVPTSEHPLPTSPDASLLGSWRGKMKDGAPVFLHFVRSGDQVRAILVGAEKDAAAAPSAWAVFRVDTAEVAGSRYLSAWWELNDNQPVEGSEQGFHLLRYVIGPKGRLLLFAANDARLSAAVEAKKVQGSGRPPEVRLTASSEALVAFLKGEKATELFDQPFATLTKL